MLHTHHNDDSLMSIEIEEENELVMFDDIFDESQSGIMPFWLKSTRSVLLPAFVVMSG